MKKYVIERKYVCAGSLLKTEPFQVFDSNNNKVSKEELTEQGMSFSCSIICRGMLFNVNENELADDLIYTTPTNYPIEGIEPKIDIHSEFIIERYVELEELLKYLGYGVDLTQNDLNQIYRKFITHNWWLNHHMELFGWRNLGRGMGYGSDGIETIPMGIYRNLSSISCTKDGRPYREEPGYRLIKRKR